MNKAVSRAQRPSRLSAALDGAVGFLMHSTDPRRAALHLGATAVTLAVIGVFVQFAVVGPESKDPMQVPLKQTAFLAMGILAAALAAGVGFRFACRLARPALWLTWGPLVWLVLNDRGTRAARWLSVADLKIQPSEFAKIILILFFAAYAVGRGDRMASLRHGFLPAMGYLLLTTCLVALAPDLGQTLFIVAASGAVLLVGGMRAAHFLPTVFVLGCGGLAYMGGKWGYIQQRVEEYFAGGGFQVRQGFFFLERGGWTGVGLADARAHTSVPEIHNDFALVVVGEIAGFLGTATICLLFLALVWNGLRIAFAAKDRLGFLVAFGLTFMLGMQAIVNLAVVTGSVPAKGMSLPFVSYGGSSMLVCAVSIGLIISVARDSTSDSAALAAAPQPES